MKENEFLTKAEFADYLERAKLNVEAFQWAASHQLETFEFPNNTGAPVNDLHIVFDLDKVRTNDKGSFKKAKTSGKAIDLTMKKGAVIANGAAETLTFERVTGGFKIKRWYWTVDNEKKGAVHEGPPG